MVYPGVQLVPFFLSLVCDLSQSAAAATTIRDGSGHVRRLRQGAGARGHTLGLYTPAESLHVPRLSYARHGGGLSPVPDGEKTTGLGRLGARGMSWPLAGVAEATPCSEQCPPCPLHRVEYFEASILVIITVFFHSLEVLEVKKNTDYYHKVFFTYQVH